MKVQFCVDNSHLQPGSTGDDNSKFTSEWKQISFTSNSVQTFSLEFSRWASHHNHSLGNLTGHHAITLSVTTLFIYNWEKSRLCSANDNHSPIMRRACDSDSGGKVREIKFQWKYLKEIGCEWDLLHGMSSHYPQINEVHCSFNSNCR